MPTTPRNLEGGHAESARPRLSRRRHTDKLLTVDRALLAGIFAAGAWYATTDLRHGNVAERVQALERRQEQILEQRSDAAVRHAGEIATIEQRLKEIERRTVSIEENLSKLATSTARLANSARDPQ